MPTGASGPSTRPESGGDGVRVIAELAGSAGVGGGERYLEVLLQQLDPARFRPTVICPEEGPFVARMAGQGVQTAVVPLAPLINPFALVRLAVLLRKRGVSVLQTHGARSTFYGLLAGRLAGVPVLVATLHNRLHDYDVPRWRRRVYVVLLRAVVRLADRVICVSEALRTEAVSALGVAPSRAVTIYNGIDPQRFRRATPASVVRDRLQLGQGPVLVSIGRLTEQKGHRYLLQALPGLLKAWPTLRCVIVGEGPMGTILPALARELGCEDACRFLGARQDVPDLLAAATALILPSVSEGFPFILLEAMSLAIPVVATTIDGVRELIQSEATGTLVPPRDPAALAEAIQRLLRDPEGSRRRAEAGRRMVLDRFTAAEMSRRTMAVLEDVWADKQRQVRRGVWRAA